MFGRIHVRRWRYITIMFLPNIWLRRYLDSSRDEIQSQWVNAEFEIENIFTFICEYGLSCLVQSIQMQNSWCFIHHTSIHVLVPGTHEGIFMPYTGIWHTYHSLFIKQAHWVWSMAWVSSTLLLSTSSARPSGPSTARISQIHHFSVEKSHFLTALSWSLLIFILPRTSPPLPSLNFPIFST